MLMAVSLAASLDVPFVVELKNMNALCVKTDGRWHTMPLI